MLALILQAASNLPAPSDKLPLADPAKVTPIQAAPRVEAGSLMSGVEINLTVIILFFGVLSLLLLYLLVRLERANAFTMRIYVITILIFGSLLVVSSAYTTAQISPVIGFFGTIAGYILGRGDRRNEAD
jgi:hypothetical protein